MADFIFSIGWLVGLADLHTGKKHVQDRIAAYLTDLLSIGFSGFRIDAAKHIKPSELADILGKLTQNMGNKLPDDFISWSEVIMGGEKDLWACRDGPYNFYENLDREMRRSGMRQEDVDKVKMWSSDYPKEFPIW